MSECLPGLAAYQASDPVLLCSMRILVDFTPLPIVSCERSELSVKCICKRADVVIANKTVLQDGATESEGSMHWASRWAAA